MSDCSLNAVANGLAGQERGLVAFEEVGKVLTDYPDCFALKGGIKGDGFLSADGKKATKEIVSEPVKKNAPIDLFGENLIINGNCYDLLEKLDVGIVDLIVTDPPYVLNSAGITTSFKSPKIYNSEKFKEICNGYDIDLFLKLCSRVCKKMNCLVFCSNAQIAPIMQWAVSNDHYATLLVWHKSNAIPFCKNSWKPDLEFIVHIREPGSFFNGDSRNSSKLYSSPTNPSRYGHPTEKPLNLLSKLIQAASKEGDLILDPFAGSGTSLVAGLKLKRKVLGFEIKEEYCQAAKRRLKDFLIQGDLFL